MRGSGPLDGPMPLHVKFYDTDSLEDHALLIHQQVQKSMRDPATRKLAVALASGQADWIEDPQRPQAGLVPAVQYHGKWYRVAPAGETPSRCGMRQHFCEIVNVWNFLVLNVAYRADTNGVDTYQDLRTTLESGGGDCVPGDTLLLRDDGQLVPIQNICVGERIWDGSTWTRVTNWWDKGIRETRAFTLNNGSVLRCTDDHLLFKVPRVAGGNLPGALGTEVELRAKQVDVGDDLLQPRGPLDYAGEELDEDIAYALGLYISEGWRSEGRVCISGIPGRKGHRECLIEIADRRGWGWRALKANPGVDGSSGIRFRRHEELEALADLCGRVAPEKRLPHTRWGLNTIRHLLRGLEADGGYAASGTFVFSTTSPTLALQYRMLRRALGHSVHIRRWDEHGGLGSNPIYRCTVRTKVEGRGGRPWAKVRGISDAGETHVFDIETESHRIYFPESDVITHNCDDATIAFSALLQSIGYPVWARIVSEDGEFWSHVYPVVMVPKTGPVALDITEPDKKPGWEFSRPARVRDFSMTEF